MKIILIFSISIIFFYLNFYKIDINIKKPYIQNDTDTIIANIDTLIPDTLTTDTLVPDTLIKDTALTYFFDSSLYDSSQAINHIAVDTTNIFTITDTTNNTIKHTTSKLSISDSINHIISDTTIDIKVPEFNNFNNFFAAISPEVQSYKGQINKTINIKTKAGTRIQIPENCLLYPDNTPVTGQYIIYIKEYNDYASMYKDNVTTLWNGKILAANSIIYIEIKQKNKILKLAPQKEITIKFTGKFSPRHSIYYGNRQKKYIKWEKAKYTSMPYPVILCHTNQYKEKFIEFFAKYYKLSKPQMFELLNNEWTQSISFGKYGKILAYSTGNKKKISYTEKLAYKKFIQISKSIKNFMNLSQIENKNFSFKFKVVTKQFYDNYLKKLWYEEGIEIKNEKLIDSAYYVNHTGWILNGYKPELKNPDIKLHIIISNKNAENIKVGFKNFKSLIYGKPEFDYYIFPHLPDKHEIIIICTQFKDNKIFYYFQNKLITKKDYKINTVDYILCSDIQVFINKLDSISKFSYLPITPDRKKQPEFYISY